MINNLIKDTKTFYDKKSWIFYFTFFLGVNILFNYNIYWKELFFDSSKTGAVLGEVQATQWGMKIVYDKFIHFKNPFTPLSDILYPFGIDIVGADPGMSFNLIFFEPFLSTHQAYSMIIVSSLLLANIGMYLLLRRLAIRKEVAFIIALAYGYMTFLTERLGHPTYFLIYLLPFYYYSLISFLQRKNTVIKVLTLFFTVFMSVLTLWQNIYYFIILVISSGFLFIYFFITERTTVLKLIRANIVYILLAPIIALILLLPWLQALYKSVLFAQLPESEGWAGAIVFSSDLFGFFIPSDNNYYYGNYVALVIDKLDITFAKGIFENFTYPGIIIISLYTYLIFNYKKLVTKLRKKISPFLLTSIIFAVLSLGPFLHVLGRWRLVVDDGIPIVFPLPFVVLHYIPLLGNIRAPGRLIVGFIFFAYIVCAFILSHLFKNKKEKFIAAAIGILLLVFLIDHRYADNATTRTIFYPNRLYSEINEDNENVSVLEIPFSVRDGFTYFGDYNSINTSTGNLVHNKPFIGGYSGRIPEYVKNYYYRNPLIGYFGRKIDLNIESNPIMNESDIQNWQNINISNAKLAADFLDIKYVVLNMDYPYSNSVSHDLTLLGYKKISTEKHFTLWQRDPSDKELLAFSMNEPTSNLMLGLGWYELEEDFRWTPQKSSVLFKVQKERKFNLHLKGASFYTEQNMDIYLNKEKVATVELSPHIKEKIVDIDKPFKEGINQVHFIFERDYAPADIITESKDNRKIGGKFTEVSLIEKK